jgi:D-arabinose 5-phosphate isomerase GutQ
VRDTSGAGDAFCSGVAIGLTYGKSLPEACDIGARLAASVITVTENTTSPLALGADIVLPVDITREIDPLNTQGTTSFTVFSVLFDAIQCEIMRRSGETEADFGLIHPGGAVGERLNGKKVNG